MNKINELKLQNIIKIKCRKVVRPNKFTYEDLKDVGRKLNCVIVIIFNQSISENEIMYLVSAFKNNLNLQV